MKLQIVPASHGVQWVRLGFRMFFRKPLAYVSLFGVVIVLFLGCQLVPWIGPAVFLALLPLITLGFMIATNQVLRGEFPNAKVFVDPLAVDKPKRNAQWQLGIAYAAVLIVVAIVQSLIDGGRTQALQQAIASKASAREIGALLSDTRLQLGMLWFTTAATVLSAVWWYAPALAHWGGHSAAKALFFSTMGVWRNKAAFTVYGLAWIAVVLTFTLASSLIFMLLGTPQLAALALVPAMLLYMTAFYASLWFTFVQCFEMPPEHRPPLTTRAA